MSRPLRIEFPGALYHVTARGDRREDIFEDDHDRACLLDVVAQATERFDASVLAYCLMSNHYHFVLQTQQANLSLLMRHINGVYSQAFNRRHHKVGHVFQGRFKAILVDKETYLMEVCRYVELNPVRAGMVPVPAAWPWSSYRAHTGSAEVPAWLDTASLLAFLLGQEPATGPEVQQAQALYSELVAAGRDAPLWERSLNKQIYLGDDRFVAHMQAQGSPSALRNSSVPRAQRQSARTLADWLAVCPNREEALWRAHVSSGLTMTALAKELGLSVARVSQLIAKAEADNKNTHQSSVPH